jgi:hypothetical protein
VEEMRQLAELRRLELHAAHSRSTVELWRAMATVLRVLLCVWAQSPSTATHCGWRVAEVGHVLVLDARGRRDLRWEPTQPILGLCAEYSEYVGRASAIEH